MMTCNHFKVFSEMLVKWLTRLKTKTNSSTGTSWVPWHWVLE